LLPAACSATQHRLDLLLEPLPTKGEVAIGGVADLLDHLRIKLAPKELSIGLAPRLISAPEREVLRVRGKKADALPSALVR
jgi:hypothetical protein